MIYNGETWRARWKSRLPHQADAVFNEITIEMKRYVGEKKIVFYGTERTYNGEVDLDGNPCGYGILDFDEYWEGTFLNNQTHGIGNYSLS